MKLRNKKTSEVYDVLISAYGISGDVAVSVMDGNAKSGYEDLGRYKTLAELNEEWEDYTPAEPLIKDEKIRKAVRAWADVNGIKEIIIFDHSNNAPYTPVGVVVFAQNSGHLEIQFRTEERFDTDRGYTVTELCGEEE
jgi:hypothetical protein